MYDIFWAGKVPKLGFQCHRAVQPEGCTTQALTLLVEPTANFISGNRFQ